MKSSSPSLVRQVPSRRGVASLATSLFLVALLSLLVSAPAAAAEKAAMLPTSGSADADTRGRLDVALRKAFNKRSADVSMQSARDTGSHISSMAELGVVCDNDDVACLQKLGIVAGVTRLFVVEASGKRTLEVKITLVNVDDGEVIRTVDGDITLGESEGVAALVERAINGEPAIPGILDTTPAPTTTAPVEPVVVAPTTGPVDETELSGGRLIGAVVGGVGAGVGGIGLIGALTSEAIFWTGTGPAATRRDVIAPLGAVMWVVGGVGLVAAAVGGIVFLVSAPAEDSTAPRLE